MRSWCCYRRRAVCGERARGPLAASASARTCVRRRGRPRRGENTAPRWRFRHRRASGRGARGPPTLRAATTCGSREGRRGASVPSGWRYTLAGVGCDAGCDLGDVSRMAVTVDAPALARRRALARRATTARSASRGDEPARRTSRYSSRRRLRAPPRRRPRRNEHRTRASRARRRARTERRHARRRPRLCHPVDDATRRELEHLLTPKLLHLEHAETSHYQRSPRKPNPRAPTRRVERLSPSLLTFAIAISASSPLPSPSRPNHRITRRVSVSRGATWRASTLPPVWFRRVQSLLAPCVTTMVNAIKTAYDTANATLQ